MSDEQLEIPIDAPTDAPVEAPTETPTEEPKEKVVFDEAQQEVIDSAMARQSAARRKDREGFTAEAQTQAARIAELESQVPKVVEPAVLPVPDQLDDDFEEKQLAYVESIRVNAQYNANQATLLQQEQATIAAANKAAVDDFNTKSLAFVENSKKLNISNDDLGRSIETMNLAGLDPSLMQHMIGLPQGPSIYKFLADPANASELDSIRAMSPMDAAAHIAASVIPSAISATPKVDAPLDPPDPLGGGVLAAKERGPKGVVYE